MKSLKGSKTAENLMKSFAGECQARTRYTYYSSVAKKEGYVQISNIFMETAENEKEHAKRFYKFLKNDYSGEQIEITAGYPVALYDDTLKNLKAAASGENEEWTDLYPTFAKIADEEGYPEIAEAYKRIAYEEADHASKFAEILGEVVTASSKANLTARVEAEFGACDGKKKLAALAKQHNLDAIHDTVHEMCKDEARHGRAFKGLLDRYFS